MSRGVTKKSFHGGGNEHGDYQSLHTQDAFRDNGRCLRVIYRELQKGNIPHVRVWRSLLVSSASLEKWLAGETNKSGIDGKEIKKEKEVRNAMDAFGFDPHL